MCRKLITSLLRPLQILILARLRLFCFLLQDESTGEITFYMKGADVVMAGIVQYNDWLEEEVRAVYRGFLMQLLFSFQGSA